MNADSLIQKINKSLDYTLLQNQDRVSEEKKEYVKTQAIAVKKQINELARVYNVSHKSSSSNNGGIVNGLFNLEMKANDVEQDDAKYEMQRLTDGFLNMVDNLVSRTDVIDNTVHSTKTIYVVDDEQVNKTQEQLIQAQEIATQTQEQLKKKLQENAELTNALNEKNQTINNLETELNSATVKAMAIINNDNIEPSPALNNISTALDRVKANITKDKELCEKNKLAIEADAQKIKATEQLLTNNQIDIQIKNKQSELEQLNRQIKDKRYQLDIEIENDAEEARLKLIKDKEIETTALIDKFKEEQLETLEKKRDNLQKEIDILMKKIDFLKHEETDLKRRLTAEELKLKNLKYEIDPLKEKRADDVKRVILSEMTNVINDAESKNIDPVAHIKKHIKDEQTHLENAQLVEGRGEGSTAILGGAIASLTMVSSNLIWSVIIVCLIILIMYFIFIIYNERIASNYPSTRTTEVVLKSS